MALQVLQGPMNLVCLLPHILASSLLFSSFLAHKPYLRSSNTQDSYS